MRIIKNNVNQLPDLDKNSTRTVEHNPLSCKKHQYSKISCVDIYKGFKVYCLRHRR